jgi:hypothetical protein
MELEQSRQHRVEAWGCVFRTRARTPAASQRCRLLRGHMPCRADVDCVLLCAWLRCLCARVPVCCAMCAQHVLACVCVCVCRAAGCNATQTHTHTHIPTPGRRLAVGSHLPACACPARAHAATMRAVTLARAEEVSRAVPPFAPPVGPCCLAACTHVLRDCCFLGQADACVVRACVRVHCVSSVCGTAATASRATACVPVCLPLRPVCCWQRRWVGLGGWVAGAGRRAGVVSCVTASGACYAWRAAGRVSRVCGSCVYNAPCVFEHRLQVL